MPPTVKEKVKVFTGQSLLVDLDETLPEGAVGWFGVAYSILTTTALFKGVGIKQPKAWVRTLGKVFENGHATTFLIDLSKKGNETLTTTGIYEHGWVFDKKKLQNAHWARRTENATTDIYFTAIDKNALKEYNTFREEMGKLEKLSKDRASSKGRRLLKPGTRTVTYSEWRPNAFLPSRTNHYENCVSSSHALALRIGLRPEGQRLSPSRLLWVPSLANWRTWSGSRGSTVWRYLHLKGCNTHIPDSENVELVSQPQRFGKGEVEREAVCCRCGKNHGRATSGSWGMWHVCEKCQGVYCNVCAKWKLWRPSYFSEERVCDRLSEGNKCGGVTMLVSL
ncbi:hypothetical protein JYJ95_22255 [Corallococcus exiguus]|uniref:hypothetical protein n=1 Tax=Corallococcus exiguus TaxID=83462 RepID=UPI001A8F474F|nr:hypothetical protein [Corallococcus exiguus]MBN8469234.1 hypothetical protein [Corallococcus exiguus]